MLQDFRAFIMKGNVLDLAVAVVVGAAFNTVVQSLVDNVLNPVVAAIFGQPDLSAVAAITLRESTDGDTVMRLGAWATDIISFLIIAFSVYLVVRTFQSLQDRRALPQPESDEPAPPTELELLADIRDSLRARS